MPNCHFPIRHIILGRGRGAVDCISWIIDTSTPFFPSVLLILKRLMLGSITTSVEELKASSSPN
jgi:hypothetical protein